MNDNTIGISKDRLLLLVQNLFYNKFRFVAAICIPLDRDRFEIIYHFDRDLFLQSYKIQIHKSDEVPSISKVYPSAVYLEYEIKQKFGINISELELGNLDEIKLAEDIKLLPDDLTGEHTFVPFGPLHPSLLEPISLKLRMREEQIAGVEIAGGYVARGMEELCETKGYDQVVRIVERVCGKCGFFHSLAYCQAVEELANVKVPERALFLRVIWSEFHRIQNHLFHLAWLANGAGFEGLNMQIMAVREKVMDILDDTTGSRLMSSVNVVGGVIADIRRDEFVHMVVMLDELVEEVTRIEKIFSDNYTLRKRMEGCGILTEKQAREYGVVGPAARASGIAEDIRMSGYGAYGELEFEPVVLREGDCFARTMVRVLEIYQSIELIKQAFEKIPEGPVNTSVYMDLTGDRTARVEQPEGELLYHIRGTGTKVLGRVGIRSATHANFEAMAETLRGSSLADVPVLISSFAPCISCMEK